MHQPLAGNDRTWPLPNVPAAMRMKWLDLLFIHYPVEPEELECHLPTGLQLDTFNGQAFLGIVPFRMEDVAPRRCPSLPGISAFPELNVRTYVIANGKPGVWFFSLDATSRLAVRVARWSFHLPYMDARISSRFNDPWYEYDAVRTHRGEPPARFHAQYRATSEQFRARPGSLEFWLTARYCLYAVNRQGELLRGDIDHVPWPLQNAEAKISDMDMTSQINVQLPDVEPHLLFVSSIAVVAWRNTLVAAESPVVTELAPERKKARFIPESA